MNYPFKARYVVGLASERLPLLTMHHTSITCHVPIVRKKSGFSVSSTVSVATAFAYIKPSEILMRQRLDPGNHPTFINHY